MKKVEVHRRDVSIERGREEKRVKEREKREGNERVGEPNASQSPSS